MTSQYEPDAREGRPSDDAADTLWNVSDPYRIEGPATIQVSGGRTSGFMLRRILDAHGGTLPDDVIPTFCNTGLEHPATYRFLQDMEREWACPITVLEYRSEGDNHGVRVLPSVCEADREGRPFEQLIEAKKYLPNPVTRYCTMELKVRTSNRFCRQVMGWDEWECAIGFRADEQRRVAKMRGDVKAERMRAPMAEAAHTAADVLEFWRGQNFDLLLPGGDNTFGNCVGCFLKGAKKLEKIGMTDPGYLEWWAQQEERAPGRGAGATFRNDRPTYRQMLTQLTIQGRLFDGDALDDSLPPCYCTD